MERILVVDDEKNYLLVLEELLRDEGFDVVGALSAEQALALASAEEPDLVLTDMRMPGMGGLELISRLKQMYPDLPIVVMTAYGTVDNAVEAMKRGASDYIQKPFENAELLLRLNKALEVRRLLAQRRMLLEQSGGMGEMVGTSPAMKRVYELIDKVAPTPATVLITGASGTGKELVARAIHSRSPRAGEPFVAINCAAIPAQLLESELFGHEKGAFTGAVARRKGRFELAHGGSVLLDEIAEMPPELQAKLLRFLQEREFTRVGGTKPVRVDVRIIAATNRDLEELVARGAFREDLYYRLNVVRIHLPPLRERPQDIPALAQHFIELYSRRIGRQPPTLTPQALELLMAHSWPGNVRELENMMERAVILAETEITPAHLPLAPAPGPAARLLEIPAGLSISQAVEMVERRMITEALKAAGGVAAKAARALGLTKSALAYKLKKYGIAPESFS